MSEKYGFVYIWHDRKDKRFYVGAHWGNVDDGYICSSQWMRRSYKNRPHHFKRRILAYTTSKEAMYEEERRWLGMIKEVELGRRYYNLKIWHMGHWNIEPEYRQKSIKEKISEKTKAAMSRPEVRTKYEAGLKTRQQSHDDPAYRERIRQTCLSKNLNKGMLTVRYPHEDKCFHVSPDDPRWLNGELVNAAGYKKSTRIKGQGRKKGDKHHMFTGYYHTPWGKFTSAGEAASACPHGSICEDLIWKWCKQQNDLVFGSKGRPLQIMQPEWKEKTRREVGFYFEEAAR